MKLWGTKFIGDGKQCGLAEEEFMERVVKR